MKTTTLAALCTALECTPNDLIEVDTTPSSGPSHRLGPPPTCLRPPPPGAGQCRLCDRRRSPWARGNGTASPAAGRSAIATASTAADAGAGCRSRPRRQCVRPAARTASSRRTRAGASPAHAYATSAAIRSARPATDSDGTAAAKPSDSPRPAALPSLRQAGLSAGRHQLVWVVLPPRPAQAAAPDLPRVRPAASACRAGSVLGLLAAPPRTPFHPR
ncbi:hypothetical protein [Streptomyces sp. enrichment culture]|uniref:helix-turn-helix domain-containing protein n=1 Tax=Streptomyces sp. enrichment culture TaxID=1795815 RepID=UPI003F568AE8